MEYIPAKTILSKNKLPHFWFGHDYNMNIYRGCSHGCIYCDSRSECYRVDHFDTVRAKENTTQLLRQELRKKREQIIVGTGAMSDPYNQLEKKYLLTRSALEVIRNYDQGVAIATKSPLITRDIDLLIGINKSAPVCLKMTITAADNNLAKKIEPHVASTSERFGAIKELSEQGLFTGVLLMPVLPFITDTEENIIQIVEMAYRSGAKFIRPYFGVTLRQNQALYYYEQLDKLFPAVKEQYIKYYKGNYECKSPSAIKLQQRFREACKDYGILYSMSEIIKAYKLPKSKKQLSLFD